MKVKNFTPHQLKLLSMAEIFGVYTASKTDVVFLSNTEVGYRLSQFPPYVSLGEVLAFKEGELATDVFSRVSFSDEFCAGYSPGRACIPLMEVGRVAKQSAALLLQLREQVGNDSVPVFRELSKIKVMSSEVCKPSSSGFWIWATVDGDKYVTRFYSGLTYNLISIIEGWNFDMLERLSLRARASAKDRIKRPEPHLYLEDTLLTDVEMRSRTPQRPPFYVLHEAMTGKTEEGRFAIRTVARFPREVAKGYLISEKENLAPDYYSRALIQTGSLLASTATEESFKLPEVLSTGRLWNDSSFIFDAESSVTVVAECEETVKTSKGHTLVLVKGTVYVDGNAVFGADQICYIMVPKPLSPGGDSFFLSRYHSIVRSRFFAAFSRLIRHVSHRSRMPY